MTEAQGTNIAEWQAQQHHQEHQGEKSGFGLGHSDSVATIVDGMKWLFNFHEGAIPAYSNVFESLVSGNLATLFGKSGNMFGIKFFESLAEYFSGGDEEDMLSEGMDMAHGEDGPHQDDFPHASDQIANDADGLHNMHNAGDHYGQSFSPSPSPSVGDDHGYELGG
ncbi:hypothetical protein EJB10_03075 [Wolbachia endosymbiont of Brugia malayi]|uniref:hypothetical protein n=1 Tax=Wolbachia endosymbiont of Brugia malayi TaxID=80849 RepID=UPI00004C92C4|nr:hypothetical protein [Wolbachia endosymbiont of Brugia malayi]AAW70771.1 Predicted protein [Wolbachia endosymbiont strain TRS of Brugia malayi]QCB61744.1 hypothetical protein EJB10_03075 [Wolbachia endosymbiont of Brugia malayi]